MTVQQITDETAVRALFERSNQARADGDASVAGTASTPR